MGIAFDRLDCTVSRPRRKLPDVRRSLPTAPGESSTPEALRGPMERSERRESGSSFSANANRKVRRSANITIMRNNYLLYLIFFFIFYITPKWRGGQIYKSTVRIVSIISADMELCSCHGMSQRTAISGAYQESSSVNWAFDQKLSQQFSRRTVFIFRSNGKYVRPRLLRYNKRHSFKVIFKYINQTIYHFN